MKEFIGAWKLIAFEEHLPTGEIIYPYGRDPAGLLIYDTSGKMSVQIMKRDRAPLASSVEGFTSFFGTYKIDSTAGVIIHHVEGHLLADSVGKALERKFEFSGDRLILRPSPTRRVVWERIGNKSEMAGD